MHIRDFTLADAPKMIELGQMMHAESTYAGALYDPEKLMQMAKEWLQYPEWRFARIAEDDTGTIYAMYVGQISEYYFGQDLVATDTLFFVRPDRRGGLAAAKLVKEFEEWAFSRGALDIRPASSSGVEKERVRQLYEALGYEVVGFVFNKRR